ncbi:HAD-IIA family hydrolase [Neptunicoccus cionae]|uniref:Haloacid dehalogenase n=1 Tax=Neptunicoccus cionae TaxID=2035344 RepID=A0A916R199_9RHOB|nr:HAD hydrolase-like protein [Amylibacter cionae]GGA26454.1 haloacid dehalogenase [Amylibacter cionae]
MIDHPNAQARAQWVFEAYEKVRPRLPQVAFSCVPKTADSLEQVAEPYDLILFDAYGVLNIGETAIAGAPERIASLRAAGKSVMVVSNSAGYPKATMMERYARLGFDFTEPEVVTSREALLHHLSDCAPRHWGVMLNPAYGTAEFETHRISFLADDPVLYDQVDGFLLVGSDGWTDHRQSLLEGSIARNQRPVIVGNPDIVAPREDGLSREPGFFAHALADATGGEPVFLGKPFGSVFERALARQSKAPEAARILMVGDTLHTDILGGGLIGVSTALVTGFGAHSGADPQALIARSGIVPDFIIPHI